jgi:hypothetical protein
MLAQKGSLMHRWVERRDLNSQPTVPKARALAWPRYALNIAADALGPICGLAVS